MANLLMIESWVGGNGVMLPKMLQKTGHAYTLVVRDRNRYSSDFQEEEHPVLKCAEEIVEADTNNIGELIRALPKNHWDGVITTCDYYIKAVCGVAEALGLPCPFPQAVETVRHKHRLRRILDAAGISNPRYRTAGCWEEVAAAAGEIGYPLVLKPVDLASSAYVRLIRNPDDLKDAFEALEAFPQNFRGQDRDCTYLLEEYMEGKEVSVEAVTFQGETHIIGVTEKKLTGDPYFVETGHMFPADISQEEETVLKEYTRAALKAAGYDYGVSHTEVKITGTGPKIVEINPRTAGGYIAEAVEMVCGVNLLECFVSLALGQTPQIRKKETGTVSACVRFLTPERGGTIERIEGAETIETDPNVAFHEIGECGGKVVGPPIDNAGRLGYIITKDTEGRRAMEYAETAISRLKLIFR